MVRYKITYMNARGLAEPCRLIMAAANIDFEDVRFDDRADWPKVQAREGVAWSEHPIPILEIEGGVRISQAMAVARFLAKRHGLAGENLVEEAKCDEYLNVINDIRLEFGKAFHGDESKKAEMMKTLIEETLPSYLTKFEAILKRNGWLVGRRMTYADIFFANFTEAVNVYLPDFDMKMFPNLIKQQKAVMNQPGIKEWIEKRPKTFN